MLYRNNTYETRTFYGVEFKPGEAKDVPGYINAIGFIREDAFILPEKHERVEDTKPVKTSSAEQVDIPQEETTTTDKRSKSKKIIKDGEE